MKYNKIFFILFINLFILTNVWANKVDNEISSIKEKSYQTSPNLKSAYFKEKESYAAEINALQGHLPFVYLNVKKQDDIFKSNSALLKSLGLTTAKSVWSLDYQWSLFNYKTILNSRLKLNESNLDSLEFQNTKKSYEVDFNTSLLNYVLAKYKKATISNSIKKAETAKKEASLGFELGQKTKIDMLRADANFVSLNSKRTSIDDEEQNSKSKLLELSGLVSTDLDFLENLNEEDYLAIIDSYSATSMSQTNFDLEKSPSLKKLNLEIKKTKLESNVITGDQWPELKIQGSYENSGDSFSDTLHRPTRSHSIALVLTIPLFNGGSLISSSFQEYYAKKRIEYLSEQNLKQFESNLKNTAIKISALDTLVKSLKLNSEQFEELFKLTTKSYQLGKSTLFELLDVQDNLLEAKINLATNKIQLYNLNETYKWQSGQL